MEEVVEMEDKFQEVDCDVLTLRCSQTSFHSSITAGSVAFIADRKALFTGSI
jgi:hypothetical protein